MNTKYNLPPDRVKTFFESYHGLAAQYGSTLAANCASCHGVHKILPSTDPRSSIYKTNLVATCGKCHPGATDMFVQSKVHVDAAVAAGTDGLGAQNQLVGAPASIWCSSLAPSASCSPTTCCCSARRSPPATAPPI